MDDSYNSVLDRGIKIFFWSLIAVISLLLLAHTGLRLNIYFHPETYTPFLFQRFNLDSEANIPTWFSTIELFIISALAFGVFILRKIRKETGFELFVWLIFALFYLFLSMDEAAQLHEIIDREVQIKWVYFYAPFAALFFSTITIYFLKEIRLKLFNKKLIILGLLFLGDIVLTDLFFYGES